MNVSKMLGGWVMLLLLAIYGWPDVLHAQSSVTCPGGPTIIRHPQPDSYYFGISLDADGSTIAAASHSSTNDPDELRIYRLVNGTWIEDQTIVVSSFANGPQRRGPVVLSGDVMAVQLDASLQNKVNVYRRDPQTNVWNLEQVITPPPGPPVAFAASVAVDGDDLVIGVPGVNNANPDLADGMLFVYHHDAATGNWLLETTLTTTGETGGVWWGLGSEVAIDDGIIAAAGWKASGVAVFRRTDGVWLPDGTAFDGDCDDLSDDHRRTIAIDDGTIVVGMQDHDGTVDCDFAQGRVLVYERSGGQWQQSLVVTAPRINYGYMGRSVDIRGDALVISWPGDDHEQIDSGSALLYERGRAGWTFSRRLSGVSSTAAYFGSSVAIGDSFVAIGATRLGSEPGTYQGALAVYDLDAPANDCNLNGVEDSNEVDCNGSGLPDWCDIASGASVDADLNFIPDECEPPSPVQVEWSSARSGHYCDERFGRAIAVNKEWVAVSTVGHYVGEVEMFRRQGPNISEPFELQHQIPEQLFGSSMVFSGGTLAVAAPQYDNWRGGVALFSTFESFPNQSEVVPLPVSTGLPNVGMNIDADPGLTRLVASREALHVFDRVGDAWVVQTLEVPCDMGGEPPLVKLNGDTIVALCKSAGRVFIFQLKDTKWSLSQTIDLAGDHPGAGSVKGRSLALSETHMACGVIGDAECPPTSGVVLAYRRDGAKWMFQQAVTAADTRSGDSFGWSVDLQGRTLAVGAPGHDNIAIHGGASYLFHLRQGRWTPGGKLVASDLDQNAQLGLGLDLENDDLIVTSPCNHNDDFYGYGTVYLFPCGECGPLVAADLTGDGVVDAQGLLALIGQWGPCAAPSRCAADLAPPPLGDGVVNVQDLLQVIHFWG